MNQKESPVKIEETEIKMNAKYNAKRIFALLGVILIGIMVLATLIVAIIPFPGSDKYFLVLLGCDIILPVLIWMYMMLYKWARRADDEVAKDALTKDTTTKDAPMKDALAKDITTKDAPTKGAPDSTDKA